MYSLDPALICLTNASPDKSIVSLCESCGKQILALPELFFHTYRRHFNHTYRSYLLIQHVRIITFWIIEPISDGKPDKLLLILTGAQSCDVGRRSGEYPLPPLGGDVVGMVLAQSTISHFTHFNKEHA